MCIHLRCRFKIHLRCRCRQMSQRFLLSVSIVLSLTLESYPVGAGYHFASSFCEHQVWPYPSYAKHGCHFQLCYFKFQLTLLVILPLWSASISLKAFSFLVSSPENSSQDNMPSRSLSCVANISSTSSLVRTNIKINIL